ncbi:MAG: DUF2207 domain-containing protein [Propionibacteriaceae bacterium]|jgi:hypothetical protein|nr:DUF2207 domain-containing protein [Propionibacteriaceae bacterium]
MSTATTTWTKRLLAGLAICVGFCVATAAPAQAATADSVDVQAALTSDGRLKVEQTITLGPDSGVATWSQDLATRMDRDGQRYTYTVADLRVEADGADVGVTSTPKAESETVSFSVGQSRQLVLSYTVTGTTITTVDNKIRFVWGLLDHVNTPVTAVSGRVEVPAGAVNYDCLAGVVGALGSCSTYGAGTHGDLAMSFTQNSLSSDQVVQADILFDEGTVAVTEQVSTIWSLGKAMSLTGTPLGILIGVVVCGGLLLFAWSRRIASAGYDGTPQPIAQLTTTGGRWQFTTESTARPGMIGTLVDAKVDPADIVATILDLAVRGHLLITEVATPRYQSPDWVFTRLDGPDKLREYESHLIEALTRGGSVSQLSTELDRDMASIQDQLYAELRGVGWFSRCPNAKSPLVTWAWAAVAVASAVTVFLVAFTSFGLTGLALVGLAIVALLLAFQARAVTPRGAAVYAGLQQLSAALHDESVASTQTGQTLGEISRVLPYAVVLGGWDRWLKAIVDLDTDEEEDSTDLSWYHAPTGWHMADLPASLDAFITVVTGRLFSRS